MPGEERLENFKEIQEVKCHGNHGPLTIVNVSEKTCKMRPENVHWVCL